MSGPEESMVRKRGLRNPQSLNPQGNPQHQHETAEDHPEGYPGLAAFLDSGGNLMIYRRFGYPHARTLLQKQDELRETEERLDETDQEDKNRGPKAQRCPRSRLHDELRDRKSAPGKGETRIHLLWRAEDLVREYGMNL